MKTTLTLWLAFTVGLAAAAAQDWTAWQWQAPVNVRETGMTRLALPPAVLDVSRADLGDLRLLSPNGIESGILKTKIVEGFNGIPKYPIKPDVMQSGRILVTTEAKIIFHERNIYPINKAINKMAKIKDSIRFPTK